jgi:MFS family permease
MTAAVLTGKTVDWNFRRHTRRLDFPITKGCQSDINNFPIERARLEVTCPLMLLGAVCIIAYGWIMHVVHHLAGPLILLFFLAFSISGVFSSLSTLMVDLYPEAPGTATAANNLVRCWIGAAAVAGVGPLLNHIGTGWFGVLVAGVWVGFSPLLWVVHMWGAGWREDRRVRDEKKRKEDSEKQVRVLGDV